MMKDYIPNEKIVDKAVKIWIELLRKPVFDNGDDNGMASMLAGMISIKTTEEQYQKFGEILKLKLMIAEKGRYYTSYLAVDYHPERELAKAAEEAGITQEFPWKTIMYLRDNCLSISLGYGAEDLYYYPLSNGMWLITYLHGSDIDKVIALIEDNATGFRIEN